MIQEEVSFVVVIKNDTMTMKLQWPWAPEGLR
jgi:hypothetical protein